MKTLMRFLILCSVVCMVSSAASAQQKSRKKPSAARPICRVQSVPKGMVIVAHKTNPACGESMELVVRRPITAETVCANSPIPDGYTVDNIIGSTACSGDNPLTNALAISKEGLYGIKIGMTSMQVTQKLGPWSDISRGTRENPAKGYTWSFRGPFTTLHIYFADDSTVSSYEEVKSKRY